MHDHAYKLAETTMDSKRIGTLIRDTRQALGMRQDELASVAGLSTRTLSDIENGKASAQIALVLKALEALGIEMTLNPPTTAGITPQGDR